MAGKPISVVAREALIAKIVEWLVSGTVYVIVAIIGIRDIADFRAILRQMEWSERLLWIALFLAVVLLIRISHAIRRRSHGATLNVEPPRDAGRRPEAPADRGEHAQTVGLIEPEPPVSNEPDPRRTLPLGKWIPELAMVEHAGALWRTTMPPIPDSAIGREYQLDPDDIGVRSPPLCPNCRTELTMRRDATRRSNFLDCVNCDWHESVLQGMSQLRREAELKVRGQYRRQIEDK